MKLSLRDVCADALLLGENFLLLQCDKEEGLVQKNFQMAIFALMLAEGVWRVLLLEKSLAMLLQLAFGQSRVLNG